MSLLLDSNVLGHAVYKGSPVHAAAAELVDRGLRHRDVYCIAPQNLVEFAAVVTRPRLVSPPWPGREVVRIAELLYRSRRLAKIYPSRGTVIRAMDGRQAPRARTSRCSRNHGQADNRGSHGEGAIEQ